MGLWGAIKKAINSKFTENPLDVILQNDLKSGFPLQNEFGWAGGRFPFAGESDITISSNTTWTRATYPQGFVKVKKLTINASRTLTIHVSPFVIFADEIVGGGANAIIDASGPNGAGAAYTCEQPWGGFVTNTGGVSNGGCGGGFLIVICKKFSGTAVTIKANGGNGYYVQGSGTPSPVSGVGAFMPNGFTLSSSISWAGLTAGTHVHPLGLYLGDGGNDGGKGGTSGHNGTGGSGIGGGGSFYAGGSGHGKLPSITPNVSILLELFKSGCRGGGGGAAQAQGSNSGGGGGGGGAILVFVNDATSVAPTLQANGGVGSTARAEGPANGAAGIALFINLAA